MPFHVGQKVTLKRNSGLFWLNERGETPAPGIKGPVHGEIYTVVRCRMGVRSELLSFAELETYSYDASAFRPVVERKTDIGIFTKILDDCKVRG